MTVTEKINNLLNIKDSYQAPQRIMEILYSDKETRDKYFMDFLNAFDMDVTYDWFHEYFQDEHADRKKHKQDFTPNSISQLLIIVHLIMSLKTTSTQQKNYQIEQYHFYYLTCLFEE